MWTHPATRANVARLPRRLRVPARAAGVRASSRRGSRASGGWRSSGTSSMPWSRRSARCRCAAPDPAARPPVVAEVRDPDLEGRHVVVSAGGTAEAIDPVRFIGNRSTGKMGVAIAEAALARGARVTIVAGRVEVPLPAAAARRRGGVDRRRCATPSSTPSSTTRADVLVMAAAVADFRPRTSADTKLTRGEGLHLDLEPTEDILAEVGRPGRRARPAPGHRRVRGRDRLAGPRPRQAPPQGRRPARRQRRVARRDPASAPTPTAS